MRKTRMFCVPVRRAPIDNVCSAEDRRKMEGWRMEEGRWKISKRESCTVRKERKR